jgi:hypothetical protein
VTVSLDKAVAKAEQQAAKPAAPAPAAPVKTLPTAPSTKLQDKDLVAPATSPATQSEQAPAAKQPKKSLLALIEEHFVQIDDLRDSGNHFPFRGVCRKCGWHTHQFSYDEAFVLTRSHAQTHWRDVQRFM